MPYRNKPRSRTVKATWPKLIPLLILLLAFGLQLGYLGQLRAIFPASFGVEPFCGVDARAHLERASGLLDGSLPGSEPFFFIPLYPIYLATLKALLGDSLLLPVLFQGLLQLIGLAALYGLGRQIFSPLTGALAALGWATYPYYLFYQPCLDQLLLTVPFLTLGLWALLQFQGRQQSGWLLLAGLSLALATLSRPTILIIYPIILFWLWLNLQSPISNGAVPLFPPAASGGEITRKLGHVGGSRGDTPRAPLCCPKFWGAPLALRPGLIPNFLLLLLPFLLLVAPITWHNTRVSGRFILLSDNFDVNLYTGNNPDAAGLDSLAHAPSQPAAIRFVSLYPSIERGETSLSAEVGRYIREQPLDWLELTLTKARLWFVTPDEPLVSPFFPVTVNQSALLSRLPLAWPAVAVAALLGLLWVRPTSPRRLLLLLLVYGSFSAATILFFVQLRFRLPFVPFVLLLAAALLASAADWLDHQPRRFWLVLALLLLAYPFVPGLWIFILLFGALALSSKKNEAFVLRPSAFVLWGAVLMVGLYLVAVGLWLQSGRPAAAQTIDHYLGPPLAGSGVLGQTFQVDCQGLSRIELTLGLLTVRHDQPVTFALAGDSTGREILFAETFDGASVADYQSRRFSFPAIANSAGRPFFFFLTSPSSTPQNGITARGYTDIPVDRYPPGQAWAGELENLRPLQADFAFKAFCQ